jgi:hypothetical protein
VPLSFRRRSALKFIATAAAGMIGRNSPAAPATNIRLGAIRWDAWYGPDTAPKSSEWYAAHDLDPPQYQRRAPFFARQISDTRLSIDGTQEDMDAEIAYAANAGIKYWAFGWYPAGRPLHKAWEFYDSSAQKALVNWCALIGLNSLAERFPPQPELMTYFQKPQYEKVDGRPLLFVMHEKSDLPRAARSLSELRFACSAAGIESPYIIAQCSVAKPGASDANVIGADAISAYSSAPYIRTGPIPYTTLDRDVRRFWMEMAATGLPVVPNGMTGWDLRPRIEHPPPFDPIASTMDRYVAPGTPQEIAAHVEAMVSFIKANPRTCRPQTALIYSWNECDEGGSVLCPTWSKNGPDDRILAAISAKLK